MLYLTKGFLEDGDLRVDTALSAKEALQTLSGKEYDVVVSDYKMPEMDGLEFLGELRRQGNATPFIFITGRGGEEVAAAAFKEGANGYIIKGKTPEFMVLELMDSIKKSVARRRSSERMTSS